MTIIISLNIKLQKINAYFFFNHHSHKTHAIMQKISNYAENVMLCITSSMFSGSTVITEHTSPLLLLLLVIEKCGIWSISLIEQVNSQSLPHPFQMSNLYTTASNIQYVCSVYYTLHSTQRLMHTLDTQHTRKPCKKILELVKLVNCR